MQKILNRFYIVAGKWYFQFGVYSGNKKPRWIAFCMDWQYPCFLDDYIGLFNYQRKMKSIREFGISLLGARLFIKLD